MFECKIARKDNNNQDDEKDQKIDKLRVVNQKLLKQLHDLNYLIQRTIEIGDKKQRDQLRNSTQVKSIDRSRSPNESR